MRAETHFQRPKCFFQKCNQTSVYTPENITICWVNEKQFSAYKAARAFKQKVSLVLFWHSRVLVL